MTRIGQLIITGSSKTSSMYHQRKKPALLRWTQAWRRQHKKLNVEAMQKKRTRKVIKVARAIVGANLEEASRRVWFWLALVIADTPHSVQRCS